MAKLKIAMLATPWISIPPDGYGGTERVVYELVQELRKLGVEVDLFTISSSRIKPDKLHAIYKEEQFKHIYKPLYESSPVIIGHILHALNTIKAAGDYDIIHDHNPYLGPAILEWATEVRGMPPAVHTHHGPPFSDADIESNVPDNTPMWQQLGHSDRLYYIGISNAIMKQAPRQIKPRVLSAVHNAIDVNQFPFQDRKKNHFITLARFTRDKGQHTAARLCHKLGYRLHMMGIVVDIGSPRKLLLALANPLSEYRQYADFKYYHDFVWPITRSDPYIKYVGNLGGERKMKFLSEAKALLFPIDWEEPFGVAPIEALACGTPVVAMKRGALPEYIEHGVNGFLANNISEFEKYMGRVDEIDPATCRESVKKHFASSVMAKNYLDRYQEVIKRDKKI